LLQENLKYLRKSQKQTQREVADLIGIARTTWIKFEKGTQSPRVDILEKVANIYGVSIEELMYQPLSEENLRESQRSKQTKLVSNQRVPLIPATAKAGYLQGYADSEFLNSLPCLSLPDLRHGTFRAFSLEGDSMPPIHDGFIVVGQSVENVSDLKQKFRYVFVTQSEGITFKRVASIEAAKKMLILSSDNPYYKPFTLFFEEILEIWSFYSFIGYPEDHGSPYMK
jgi:transcriptional regulator with XRE-family HTH domain